MLKSGSTWSEHWKTRYFILSDGKLTWYVVFEGVPFSRKITSNKSKSFVRTYKTSHSPTLEHRYVEASDYPEHPRNQIVVDKETEIHVVNLQKFKFKLCRGNKELLLSTLNESEMHEWSKALKQVISGEFHAKLMKDEKHRELREKQRKQDEKRAKEMAEAQRLACLESVSCLFLLYDNSPSL